MKLLTSYLAACNNLALGSTAAAQHRHDSPAALQPAMIANTAAEPVTSLDQHLQSSIVAHSPDSSANKLSIYHTLPAANKLVRTSSSSLNMRHTTAKGNTAPMVPNMQLDTRAEAISAAVHHTVESDGKVPHEVQSDSAAGPGTGCQLMGIAQCTEMWAEACGNHIPTVTQIFMLPKSEGSYYLAVLSPQT